MVEIFVECLGVTEEEYVNQFVLEVELRENLQEIMLWIDFFLLLTVIKILIRLHSLLYSLMNFDKYIHSCKYYPNQDINLCSFSPSLTTSEATRWIAFGLHIYNRRKGRKGNSMEGTVCKGMDMWVIKKKYGVKIWGRRW